MLQVTLLSLFFGIVKASDQYFFFKKQDQFSDVLKVYKLDHRVECLPALLYEVDNPYSVTYLKTDSYIWVVCG